MKLYKGNLELYFELKAESEEEARALMIAEFIKDVLMGKNCLVIWGGEELATDKNKGAY